MEVVADARPRNRALRSQGQEFARRLESAGVTTTSRHYDGVMHEFFGAAAVLNTRSDEAVGADDAGSVPRQLGSRLASTRDHSGPVTSRGPTHAPRRRQLRLHRH